MVQENLLVENQYGGRLRVRACGVCVENDRILLVNHRGLTASNTFWSPPGGGVDFGETIAQTIAREFLEETGYGVEVGQLLFVSEVVRLPLHAIEIFYEVKIIDGSLTVGHDPEMADNEQIIQNVAWLGFEQIRGLANGEAHQIFGFCEKLVDIYELNSYITIR